MKLHLVSELKMLKYMMLRKNPLFFSTLLASLLTLHSTSTTGQSMTAPIAGFQYGDMLSPKGNEWESPQLLSLNKELPHASFFSFFKR
jgi:beta-galactosidase